jgi:hypothetical protein
MIKLENIYNTLLKAGFKMGKNLDVYRNDIYIEKNLVSTKIVTNYQYSNLVTTFKCNITGKIWYEIPCAYYK